MTPGARLATETPTHPVPGVLVEWRCRVCGRVIGQYVPPITYVSRRCKCGAMNVLATAPKPAT